MTGLLSDEELSSAWEEIDDAADTVEAVNGYGAIRERKAIRDHIDALTTQLKQARDELNAARSRAVEVQRIHEQALTFSTSERDALAAQLADVTRRRSIGGTPPAYTHNTGESA